MALAATRVLPKLSITAEERWDDDVLAQNEATFADGLLSKLTPKAGLDVATHTFEFQGWYALDLTYHQGSGTLSADHRGELTATWRPTRRDRLELDLKLWRVSDPTSLPRLGLSRTLAPVLYGESKIAFSRRLTHRWNGEVGFDSQLARIYDANETLGLLEAPYAEALYRMSRRLQLGVGYRFEYFRFGDLVSTSNGAYGKLVYALGRHTGLVVLAGPVSFLERGHPDHSGWLPRFDVALHHKSPRYFWGLQLGHDLMGASGLTDALWADYATGIAGWRLSEPVSIVAAGSFFRNGPAPGQQAWSTKLSGPGRDWGYAAELGLTWKASRTWALKATVDHIHQVGNVIGAPKLTRNIFALRAIATAW